MPSVTCLDCGRARPHKARGLCSHCYDVRLYKGTLDERPPLSGRKGNGLADSPLADGLTYRQLDYWCRQGYLKPGGGTGSGSWRTWPDEERAVARLMKRLVDAGLTVEAAHRVARAGGTYDLGPGVRVHIDEEGAAA